jgi:PE family
MSYVIAEPETLVSAAADLATLDSSLSAAHLAAAAPTVALMPAAADEVSADIAHLFSQHAEDYQALAGQAAALRHQLIHNLNASAQSYAGAEAANVASLQTLGASAGSLGGANAAAQTQSPGAFSLLPVNVTVPQGVFLFVLGFLLLPIEWPFILALVLAADALMG